MPLANVEARTTRIDCPNCAKTAENEIQRIAGVAGARVDLLNAKIYYAFDTDTTDAESLRQEIESLGHFKFVEESRAPAAGHPFSRALGWSLFAAVMIYSLGAVLRFGLHAEILGAIAFYLATAVGGWDIVRRAFVGVRHKRLDINALMSIAIVGAIILGDLHEAVVVVLLFGVANMLESYSLWRLSKTLGDVSDIGVGQALLKRGSEIVSVPPESLKPSDIIVLKEGMRIPADGVVALGRSYIDMASLTGESQPRSVTVGDEVFAGAINLDGYLEVTISTTVSDSHISTILKMIGEASARKARIERFVDRFAHVYTPIVVSLACLVAVVPPLFFEASLADWFYKALVFLVISCPCALVISTPIAVTTALAAASRMKAVFKGGDSLERLATINTLAFDKTGTLTTGNMHLARIENHSKLTDNEILRIAGSLEQISQHPLAKTVLVACSARQLEFIAVDEPRAIPGVGVSGGIAGKTYEIRSSQAKHDEAAGHTADLLQDGVVLAGFHFSDQVRPEAEGVLLELRSNGIRRIGILSGDTQVNADRVAELLNLDFAYGGLLPDQKYERLKSLGEGTAMVGDGINDVVALSGSDVSVSLARFGNDIPAQHADIILFGDHLGPLPKLFRLGKRTLSTIKANIVLAFAIKFVFLILAAAGIANIWMAVAADMGASLLVIFNSLRLLKQ